MTKLDQDDFPCTWCTWCISAVQISVFSRGDNCGISKGMKITRTAYSRVNKITQLYYVFIQRLLCVSNIGPRLVCCAKRRFSCSHSDRNEMNRALGHLCAHIG